MGKALDDVEQEDNVWKRADVVGLGEDHASD